MKITAKHIPPGNDLARIVDGELMFRETKWHPWEIIDQIDSAFRPLIAAVLRDGWKAKLLKLSESIPSQRDEFYAIYRIIAEITAWEKGE